jgi:hypothetical protein
MWAVDDKRTILIYFATSNPNILPTTSWAMMWITPQGGPRDDRSQNRRHGINLLYVRIKRALPLCHHHSCPYDIRSRQVPSCCHNEQIQCSTLPLHMCSNERPRPV